MLLRGSALLFALFLGSIVFAQNAPQPKPVRPIPARGIAIPAAQIRPAIGRMGQPTLSQLVKAKLDAGKEEPQVIVMLPAYRMEKTEGEHFVTEFRTEQRTRTVQVNGKQVEQAYTVSVPYTETVKDPLLPVPAGEKPNSFDADQFQFYDVSGKELSLDEATKRMTRLGPTFLMDRFRGGFAGFSPLQQQALDPDCLVMITPETIRKSPPGSSIIRVIRRR